VKNEPKLELLCEYFATLKPPVVVGSGPYGMRQIFDVTGGEVTGPRLRWRVLPSGADWILIGADGVGPLRVEYRVFEVRSVLTGRLDPSARGAGSAAVAARTPAWRRARHQQLFHCLHPLHWLPADPFPGRRRTWTLGPAAAGEGPHAESSTSPARARSSGGPVARRPSSKTSPSGARPLQRMVWEWMPRW